MTKVKEECVIINCQVERRAFPKYRESPSFSRLSLQYQNRYRDQLGLPIKVRIGAKEVSCEILITLAKNLLSLEKEERMEQVLLEYRQLLQVTSDGSWQAAYDMMLLHIDALEYLWTEDAPVYPVSKQVLFLHILLFPVNVRSRINDRGV